MGPKMGRKTEPTGTETEIMINKNKNERKRLEDSGLFWGVKVEERQTSKPNWNSTPNLEAEV